MKTFLSLIFSFIFSIPIIGQIAGPKNPGSFSNSPISGSGQSWVTTSNAATSNNVYSTFGNLPDPAGTYTDYLVVSNFGFSIPAGAVINGIQVDIERADVSTNTADYSIKIVKGGNVCGTEHSSGEYYSQTNELDVKDVYKNYGSNTDLWGESWTTININEPGFGVAVAAQRALDGGMTDGRIDNIRVTVFYTPNFTLPVKLIKFSAVAKDGRVYLTWATTDESNMDRFEIQRSSNGADFNSFGTLMCQNRVIGATYAFNDYAPFSGNSQYRLKMRDNSGKVSYSNIVAVQFNNTNSTSLYPSPWVKGEALFIRNINNEKLTISFYNVMGELVAKTTTSGTTVQVDDLQKAKGILRYKVYNEKAVMTAAGSIVVN